MKINKINDEVIDFAQKYYINIEPKFFKIFNRRERIKNITLTLFFIVPMALLLVLPIVSYLEFYFFKYNSKLVVTNFPEVVKGTISGSVIVLLYSASILISFILMFFYSRNQNKDQEILKKERVSFYFSFRAFDQLLKYCNYSELKL